MFVFCPNLFKKEYNKNPFILLLIYKYNFFMNMIDVFVNLKKEIIIALDILY